MSGGRIVHRPDIWWIDESLRRSRRVWTVELGPALRIVIADFAYVLQLSCNVNNSSFIHIKCKKYKWKKISR